MNDIYLYNTKTKEKELFTPIHEKEVRIYSCGPTVYHYAHIGNLRAYIFADTLRRMFVSAGFSIQHVINITDVGHLVGDGNLGEDKLEAGARREGKTAWDVALFYTNAYFADLDALNIDRSAYQFPKATDYIQEQINLVKQLEEKGCTYTISDGVYFDTKTFPRYADFAKLDIEGLQSGARVEENNEKRNITDFALWKFSPEGTQRDMEWDSPWGKGFPGWHIECSAMSEKLLGVPFDIHTGGVDHIPVHHTNEIAQSECAHDQGTYVHYWMHVNFLNEQSGKMSKSKGEFLRLKSLTDSGILALAYRYYLLTSHYRSEIQFSIESLLGAQEAYKKILSWCANNKTNTGNVDTSYMKEFTEALYDDLNTPQAIALLWKLLKDPTISNQDKYTTIISFDKVLGLSLHTANREDLVIPDYIQTLLAKRKEARDKKDFTASDTLRDEIARHGFIVKDTQNGQQLEKK